MKITRRFTEGWCGWQGCDSLVKGVSAFRHANFCNFYDELKPTSYYM